MAFQWKVVHGGKTPPPGEVVRPDERLSWGRTAGIGAQHVVAMFGATFVFPIVMGLDPNVAIMMSGVATLLFLLITQNRVPSYLGTSASFVGGVFAIRAAGGDSAVVTGSILVAGLVLAAAGIADQPARDPGHPQDLPACGHRRRGDAHRVRPRVRGGRLLLVAGPVGRAHHDDRRSSSSRCSFGGSWHESPSCSRSCSASCCPGCLTPWAAPITVTNPVSGETFTQDRLDFGPVGDADWFGFPDFHGPDFKWSAIVLVLPAIIALIAENTGHVKAVAEMTGDDLDPVIGRAIMADGIGTAVATSVGGSPTTTYAENIGVMAATRIYSTAAYYVAGVVAILFGLIPKFGALVAATPEGVLGGVTVVLYGMIGLLGAKIWVENRVDFGNPINLVPIGAGIILAIGPVRHLITDDFILEGIALGTIVLLAGYHLLRWLAPPYMREGLSAGPPPARPTAPQPDNSAAG